MADPKPQPCTEVDLAAIEGRMAMLPSGWGSRVLPSGGIAVHDQEGNLCFTLSHRSDGGLNLAHWQDDPESPEAGFREMVAKSLPEALEMMRELVARGC